MKMKKFLSVLLFAAFATPTVYSQDTLNFSLNAVRDIPSDITVPVPQPAPVDPGAAVQQKEWTIMVFMNGKNNLEMKMLKRINQMETIGSDENITIVAELGRMKGQQGGTDLDGDWTGSRTYLIKKDTDTTSVASPSLSRPV